MKSLNICSGRLRAVHSLSLYAAKPCQSILSPLYLLYVMISYHHTTQSVMALSLKTV